MNKCKGCGTENCSVQTLHEEVASYRRRISQVQRVEIMRRNGIEPPNGFLDEKFANQIVDALLRLEEKAANAPETSKKQNWNQMELPLKST